MTERQGGYAFPTSAVSAEDCREMSEVRAEIDRLDRIVVALLAERTRYIEAAGRIKGRVDDVRLEWRIEEVVSKVLAAAAREDLPPDIAEPVWRLLIDRSIAHEFDVWRALRADEPASAESTVESEKDLRSMP
ncbi:MAG: chorismate mutase [Alphaproteobacteria bacterium]|nr:chorismate mutase [Alphaproteobacteria bacterium]